MPARPVLTRLDEWCDAATSRDPALVVIAGLPGSGKTTLLRQLLAREVPGVTGFDSEQVTARLRNAGVCLPYRLLRPWVHGRHRWRVVRGIGGDLPVVVLTDPWTSGRWRAAVLRAARRAGRSVRLVVLDASPALAESGQAARGRAISARAMRRHTARWESLLQTAAAPDRPSDADRTVIVDRQRAGGLTLGEILGPPGTDLAGGRRQGPGTPCPASFARPRARSSRRNR